MNRDLHTQMGWPPEDEPSDPNDTITATYRDDMRRLTDAMWYKLRKNAHKGHWEDWEIDHAMKLLKGEVKELEEAIADGNFVEILLEAADVANFALIVSAIAIEKGK